MFLFHTIVSQLIDLYIGQNVSCETLSGISLDFLLSVSRETFLTIITIYSIIYNTSLSESYIADTCIN